MQSATGNIQICINYHLSKKLSEFEDYIKQEKVNIDILIPSAQYIKRSFPKGSCTCNKDFSTILLKCFQSTK